MHFVHGKEKAFLSQINICKEQYIAIDCNRIPHRIYAPPFARSDLNQCTLAMVLVKWKIQIIMQ